MKIYDNIIKLHSFRDIKSISKENQNKLSILSIYSSIGVIISSIYFFNYLFSETKYYIISFISLIFFLGSFLFTRKNLNYKIPAYAISGICTILFTVLFITGGTSGHEILWIYVFPIFNLLIFELKKGTILSVILFFIIAILSIFDSLPINYAPYSNSFKLNYLISYLCILGLIYSHEYIRNKRWQELIHAMFEAKKANQTNKAKADFMAELSHQIRTPLSSILGIHNILKNTPLTDYQKELLETINASSNNLITVVNRLVDISELSVENDGTAVLTFDMPKVITHSINEFKALTPRTDLRDSINIQESIPQKLIGNPANINRLIKNILSNITQNSTKQTIHFSLFAETKSETNNAIEIKFTIQSSSPKIKHEELINKKIEYDYSGKQDEAQLKISQNHINEKEYFGTYDLTELKKTVESYGGKFGVSFIEPNISSFWFAVYLWKQGKAISVDIESPHIISESEKKELKKLSVLVVEDNLMNQKVISLALKDKVNNVDIASNGKDALLKFANSKYDIILLDLQMPVLDGYKTFAKIKETEVGTTLHTPCIALTANAMSGDKEKCISLGMDDYISKPFQVDELLSKIYRHTCKNK